jgi:hypothetical protein
MACKSTKIFASHLKLMLKKNYKIFMRNKVMFAFEIISPLFFILLLVSLQNLANLFIYQPDKSPTKFSPPIIDKCYPRKSCTTIGFGIIVNILIGPTHTPMTLIYNMCMTSCHSCHTSKTLLWAQMSLKSQEDHTPNISTIFQLTQTPLNSECFSALEASILPILLCRAILAT